MDVYILVRDELEYELIVRRIDGGTAGTVLSMREILRDLISKENVGVLVNELQDMLGNVQEFSEWVALRIEARLHHIFGRINRLKLHGGIRLFDDKRSCITKGRHEPGLETEQEDPTVIKSTSS
ncbi:hypothetical protein FQA39_LY11931 [Lamprigera yunnana]|nr:hypothetical protein FQA39_LY11931 [Lamprigera yunnana]